MTAAGAVWHRGAQQLQAVRRSQIILGNHPYYEEYLFMRATAGLSFYRQLWEIAPLVWTLLGFALLGWSVRIAFDRLSAVLVCCALLCLGYIGMLSLHWTGTG